EAIDKWDADTKRLEQEILHTEGITPLHNDRRDTRPFEILKHARFIQQNFALHQLEMAVTECTDDDLKQVRGDMKALCEIGILLPKLLNILTKDVRAELRAQKVNVFMLFLRFNKWVIWADISL